MTRNYPTGDSTNRRTFLRAASVAAALGGVPLVSGAKPAPSDDLYLDLAERREKANWDVDRWRHQLAVHGFDFKYADGSTGVSSQRLDADETKLYITYTRGSNTDWVNFEWSLNDGWGDYAAEEIDYAAIAFDGAHYDRTDYGPIYGSYVRPIVDRTDDTAPTGVVVKYDSNSHAWDNRGRFGSYFDLGVEPAGRSKWTRKIHVCYYFTAGATLSDIDIDGSDVDLDFNYRIGGDVWKRTASAYEYQMDDGDTYVDD